MGAPLMPGPYPTMPGPYGGPMDPNMAGGSPVVLASRLNEEVRLERGAVGGAKRSANRGLLRLIELWRGCG